jgi:galactose mutarotase-like enzyme
MLKLENELLTVEIDELGAEIKSVKEKATQKEYMWSGDKNVWGRVSPVLFPFVGRCVNAKYTYEGKEYPTTPHGFARDTRFTVGDTKETPYFNVKYPEGSAVVLYIEDTEETRKIYPFKFKFSIMYVLEERSVSVRYIVENKNDGTLYYSVGGHPGFKCPISDGVRHDYFLKFGRNNEQIEKIISSDIDLNTGLATYEKTEYALTDNTLKIADDLFKKDALVLENKQVDSISILDKDKKPYITVSFAAPLVGIWSSLNPGADFVCIEPWWGRCDRIDFKGTLEGREYGNKLEADKKGSITEFKIKFE